MIVVDPDFLRFVSRKNLSGSARSVLDGIVVNGLASRSELIEFSGASLSAVKRGLFDLQKEGVIERGGKRNREVLWKVKGFRIEPLQDGKRFRSEPLQDTKRFRSEPLQEKISPISEKSTPKRFRSEPLQDAKGFRSEPLRDSKGFKSEPLQEKNDTKGFRSEPLREENDAKRFRSEPLQPKRFRSEPLQEKISPSEEKISTKGFRSEPLQAEIAVLFPQVATNINTKKSIETTQSTQAKENTQKKKNTRPAENWSRGKDGRYKALLDAFLGEYRRIHGRELRNVSGSCYIQLTALCKKTWRNGEPIKGYEFEKLKRSAFAYLRSTDKFDQKQAYPLRFWSSRFEAYMEKATQKKSGIISRAETDDDFITVDTGLKPKPWEKRKETKPI